MSEKKNRERMKQALAGYMAKKPPAKKSDAPLAAAAKKHNPRSAAARDARAKARGRLPDETVFSVTYKDGKWHGEMVISCPLYVEAPDGGNWAHAITHTADGLFRLMEELDIKFWEFFATKGDEKTEEMKRKWVFDTIDHKPEPMPQEMKEKA